MFVFSVLCAASALLAFEGGLTVLRLNRRRAINIVYSVFAFNFVLCCLAFNHFVTAPNRETALLWNRILALPVTVNPALMFHFTIKLTRENKRIANRWLLSFLYIPSLFLGVLWIIGKTVPDIYQTAWGWDSYTESTGFFFLLSFSMFIGLCFASFLVVLRRYLRPFGITDKKQMRPIMFSLLIGTVGWTASLSLFFSNSDVLHTLVSNLTFLIVVTPLLLGVRWSIARHNLMTLAPQRPAVELIGGIDEPVFFADMEGNVVFQNRAGAELAGDAGKKGSYSISDIFLNGESLRQELRHMASGKRRERPGSGVCINAKGGKLAYSVKLQGIKNEADEFIGVMITATEEVSLGEFQSRYGITNRQVEIIYLSVSGLSNRKIAEKLNISERTVEHHHFNIYNKLGIENKIDLYNIALKYRIISN